MVNPEPTLSISAAPAGDLERLARAGRLYAAMDASDAPAVPEKARALGPGSAVCLYAGGDEASYEAVAPYLLRLDDAALRWAQATLGRDPGWGVFVVADINLEGLRRHFRRVLVVLSPAGVKMNFRFYDPRVLTTFLDCCTAGELDDFYGPVERFGISTEDSAGALLFRRLVESGARRRQGILQKLRPAQMRAFSRASEERFADRLVNFLQAQFPDALSEPRGQLKAAIVDQVARARGHGFTTEAQLAIYVTTAWVLGPEFDTRMPPMEEALANPLSTPQDKVAFLELWTKKLFRTLEEA
jgi:hypothetical protein